MSMEKEYVYYPIYVTTLNRHEHFKRLIESLLRNTDVEKTELVIGLDYPPSEKYREGYEKNKDYIPTITGFKKVTVFTTDLNLGQRLNTVRLVDYVRSRGYDAAISMEDDNEASPNFIQYMNWGLNHFRDDNSIYSICALMLLDTKNVEGSVFKLNNLSNGNCLGWWFEKQKKLDKYKDLNYLKILLDAMPLKILFSEEIFKACSILGMLRAKWPYGDTIVMFLPEEERWNVFPVISKLRNWGYDGSGQHGASNELQRDNQELIIDTSPFFYGDERADIFSPVMDMRVRKQYRHKLSDYVKAELLYLVYKVTGKILVKDKESKWCKVKLQKAL